MKRKTTQRRRDCHAISVRQCIEPKHQKKKKPSPSLTCEYARSTIHLAHSARPEDIISGIQGEKSIHNKHPQELLCLQLGPMDIQTEYLKVGVNHNTLHILCIFSLVGKGVMQENSPLNDSIMGRIP